MPLIQLILVICIVGVVIYLIRRFVPMPAPFQTLILCIGIIGCVLFALSAFGINLFSLGSIRTR